MFDIDKMTIGDYWSGLDLAEALLKCGSASEKEWAEWLLDWNSEIVEGCEGNDQLLSELFVPEFVRMMEARPRVTEGTAAPSTIPDYPPLLGNNDQRR
jgi:hypothetical protein